MAGINADFSFFGRDVAINSILGHNDSFNAVDFLIDGEGDVSSFGIKLPPVKQRATNQKNIIRQRDRFLNISLLADLLKR